MCIDTERFERARGRVIGIERQRLGIGTLSEKTVHAVLKNYYLLAVVRVEFNYPDAVFSYFHNAHLSDDLGNAFFCSQRKSAFLQDLVIAFLSVKHYDDNFRTACAEVHSSAHAGNFLSWNDPVGQVAVFSDFHSAENCSSYVSASYETERFSRVKVFYPRYYCYVSSAGVDDINVQVGSVGYSVDSCESVL